MGLLWMTLGLSFSQNANRLRGILGCARVGFCARQSALRAIYGDSVWNEFYPIGLWGPPILVKLQRYRNLEINPPQMASRFDSSQNPYTHKFFDPWPFRHDWRFGRSRRDFGRLDPTLLYRG